MKLKGIFRQFINVQGAKKKKEVKSKEDLFAFD